MAGEEGLIKEIMSRFALVQIISFMISPYFRSRTNKKFRRLFLGVCNSNSVRVTPLLWDEFNRQIIDDVFLIFHREGFDVSCN